MSPLLQTLASSSVKGFGISAKKAPLVLINGSFIETAITGGWSFSDGGGPTAASGSINSYGLDVTAPWWGGGGFTTINNVSLVNVVSVTYSMHWVDNINYTSSPWTNSSLSLPLNSGTQSITFQTPGAGAQNGSITGTTALSSAGGIGKISFGAGNTGSGGHVRLTSLILNYS